MFGNDNLYIPTSRWGLAEVNTTAVEQSSSVRLDADSIEISVSTKGVVGLTVKSYGDLLDVGVHAKKVEKAIELFEQYAPKLKAGFRKTNPEA